MLLLITQILERLVQCHKLYIAIISNIRQVASYIESQRERMNIVVISLKEEFYSHADALIGITTDSTKMQETGALISKVLTLDLSPYEKHF